MNASTVRAGGEPRFFYGWIIVLAAALSYAIALWPTICFGVFVKPLVQQFGWSRSEVTGAFGLFMVVVGMMSIVGGFAVDRFGPRRTGLAGGSLLGLGLFLASGVDSLWQFYLCYSVLGGLGIAFLIVPLMATIPRWFEHRRGLALGMVFAAGGVGGMALSPLTQHWITEYGWRVTFEIAGLGAAVLIVLASLPMKKEPAEIGLQPLGREGSASGAGSASLHAHAGGSEHTVGQAIRSPAFWIYSVSVILMFAGIMMAQIHMVPYATDIGIAESVAALALGVAAAANALGRRVMGAASDRIGTKRALCLSMLLAAFALFGLTAVREPWMLYGFAVAFGFAYGGVMPQNPRVIGGLFGTRFLGAIMGVAAVFTILGPALGPLLGAFVHDRSGSYQAAFLIGGTLILVAIGLVLSLDLPGPATATGKSGVLVPSPEQ